MNFRNLFLLIILTLATISPEAKSECSSNDDFFMFGGESTWLYADHFSQFNEGLSVCVTLNHGSPVSVETDDQVTMFTVNSGTECQEVQNVDGIKAKCLADDEDVCSIDWEVCGIPGGLVVPAIPAVPPIGAIKVSTPDTVARNEALDKCIEDLIDNDNVSHTTVGNCYKTHAPCWPNPSPCSSDAEEPTREESLTIASTRNTGELDTASKFVYQNDQTTATLKLRKPTTHGHLGPTEVIVDRCPEDTVLTPYDMPIYDEDGLFVIGYKKTWFCLPVDLEPEG